MTYESAGSRAEFLHVRDLQILSLHILKQIRNGNASAACRSHRSLAAYDIVTVYHFSLTVRGNRNSASDMADYIIAVFIFLLHHIFAVADRCLF